MTQPWPASRYSVRRCNPHVDADAILRQWLRTYPELDPAAARRKLESQYLYSPGGEAICLFLQHKDAEDPIGVQCLGPRRFAYGKDVLVAGITADYVVDARYRSLGPALTLLRGTLSIGYESLAFLYGFPNQKSEVIFRRIGMRSPGAITRYVRPLRSASFLTRRLDAKWQWLRPIAAIVGDAVLAVESALLDARHGWRWRWSEQDDFDTFFDECWRDGRHQDWLIGERTRETLEWRFPAGSSRRICVAIDRRSGQKQGYIIWRRGEGTVEILDIFCRRPEHQFAGLLASFARWARELGVEAIGLEFSGPNALKQAIRQAGYRARDRHTLFLSAAEGSEINSLPVESVYLTGFDRD